MIDKMSGKVSYAVLSFGGFLGIGDDYYPLPWQSLKYDTSLGGYVADVTEAQLKGAPKYREDSGWNWMTRAGLIRSTTIMGRHSNVLSIMGDTAGSAVSHASRTTIDTKVGGVFVIRASDRRGLKRGTLYI